MGSRAPHCGIDAAAAAADPSAHPLLQAPQPPPSASLRLTADARGHRRHQQTLSGAGGDWPDPVPSALQIWRAAAAALLRSSWTSPSDQPILLLPGEGREGGAGTVEAAVGTLVVGRLPRTVAATAAVAAEALPVLPVPPRCF